MSRRSPRRLRRQRQVEPRREILVFTEGRRTEPHYLKHWEREHRDRVLLHVSDFHGTPRSLVDHAVDAKRQAVREARRGRGRAHDEVWCVFDQDEHPNIREALEKAAANGIGVVLSNPCIELWFLLHFSDQTAHVDREAAQRRSRQKLECDKSLTPAALASLTGRYAEAKRRARRLDEKHAGDGSPHHSNPSSNMWGLIDRIREA